MWLVIYHSVVKSYFIHVLASVNNPHSLTVSPLNLHFILGSTVLKLSYAFMYVYLYGDFVHMNHAFFVGIEDFIVHVIKVYKSFYYHYHKTYC